MRAITNGLSALALLVAVPVLLPAQKPETVPPPIDVQVAPLTSNAAGTSKMLLVAPTTPVRIFGTSVPLGGNQIKIDVLTPAKKTATLNAGLDAKGKFTTEFKDTAEAGTYQVTAHSTDGKSQSTATFKVASSDDLQALTDELEKAFATLAAESRKTLALAKADIDSKGDFPNKAKLDQDLATIDQKAAEIPKQLTQLTKPLDDLSALLNQYKGRSAGPKIVEVEAAIGAARDAADNLTEQAKEIGGRMPKASGLCDRIDTASEALGFMSLVFDLMGSWPIKVAQILTDKILPDEAYNALVPVEKRDAGQKFKFTESMKGIGANFAGGSAAAKDFVKSPMGLAFDAIQYGVNAGFDKFCERYVGPVDGLFSVDATAAGQPSWGFKAYLKGRLIMRFEKKQATGTGPVPLTGEFEGTATKFDMYEDLFIVNKFNKASVLYRQLQQPVAIGDTINWIAAKAGRIASAYTMPNYFLIPVTGSVQGNDLTIEVGPTGRFDFPPGLKGVAHYVWSPPGALFPVVQRFDLPIQNAQFILSRALRPKALMKVNPVMKGAAVAYKSAEQTFTRQEVVSAGDVTVNWKVNVKVCNPECP